MAVVLPDHLWESRSSIVDDALPLLESRRTGIPVIRNPVLADMAMSEAPFLERCIAWAWLSGTRRR